MNGVLSRIGGLRLCTKLAAFAVLGVVVTHAIHLLIGNRVATRALARDQAQLGAVCAPRTRNRSARDRRR